ncbi:MAG: Flp family type IVb pilin [Streptosporangiaceae bacterium]
MFRFFTFTQNFLADRLSGDRGAAAVEYGLLVALIAGAIVLAVLRLSATIDLRFLRVIVGF